MQVKKFASQKVASLKLPEFSQAAKRNSKVVREKCFRYDFAHERDYIGWAGQPHDYIHSLQW